jgi:ribosomal protein S18 acetylase RimI-like enzyme
MARTAEKIVVERFDPRSFEARLLRDEFDAMLALRYGPSPEGSSGLDEHYLARGAIVIARTTLGDASGFAAFRRFDFGVAELKCIYSRTRHVGIGQALLDRIESMTRAAGYHTLMIETAFADHHAIKFFRRNGYGPALHYCFSYARENGPFLEKALV